MDLQNLIKENPTINVTISGADLLNFAEALARTTADLTLAGREEKIYTREQICRKFNISLGTLWRWDNLGLVTGKKIGRRVFYNEADVENLIKNNK